MRDGNQFRYYNFNFISNNHKVLEVTMRDGNERKLVLYLTHPRIKVLEVTMRDGNNCPIYVYFNYIIVPLF